MRLYDGDQVVRQFQVGKRAPTFGHTYVLVSGDRRVLQASGDLTTVFQTNADSLRDLSVLSFQADAITQIDATTDAGTIRLNRGTGDDDATTWLDENGTAADAELMEEAIRFLASLRATRYLQEAPVGTPLLDLALRDPAAEHRLTLYAEADNAHAATASGAEDPFVLLPFSMQNVLTAFGLADQAGLADQTSR